MYMSMKQVISSTDNAVFIAVLNMLREYAFNKTRKRETVDNKIEELHKLYMIGNSLLTDVLWIKSTFIHLCVCTASRSVSVFVVLIITESHTNIQKSDHTKVI